MKKNLLASSLCFIVLLTGCTKDRVPDPDTLNFPQTTIYSEGFDETTITSPDLPDGWSATPGSGWQTDSSNFSTGYPGASGQRNIVISNDSLSSGTAMVITKQVSTTRYKSVTVTYGARKSKHFSDNGSSISSFAYSLDDGSTWTSVPFVENTNDSNWYLINNSVRIPLPPETANQPAIKFRWTAHLEPTPSGTYRIDDFQVLGTQF